MQDEKPGSSIPDGLPVWVNDSHQLWSSLRIAQTIPLGRLEWKWRSRGAMLRDSSTSVRVSFRLSNSNSNTLPELSENPCVWFGNPYAFVYVTSITELNHVEEDSWRRVRDFVDRCREKSYEYLFILAATETEATKHKRVVDKLRTEINLVSRGPERLLVLSPAFSPELAKPITNLHHSQGHQELLVKLREVLRTGVDARIMAYDDVITRSYLSRSNASWSFPKFFVLKEGLVFVFLHLGRRDLCLKLYDELQKAMNDLDIVEIIRFCDQPAADIAMGSTNADAKDYRSMMLKGIITELDIRTYLFARQVTLLLHDRKFSEIAERGLKFITVVARRCAEEALTGNPDVSGVFRDTWVFVTSRLLSSILAPSIPTVTEAEHSLSAQLSTPRERHTARLVAGFHVNALKAFQGLAHVVLPGCLSSVGSEKSPKELEKLAEEAMATSSLKLQSALSSPENAQILHSEIANAAASLYEMGGRARGAAALDGDAGIVRLKNKNYAEAETLLSAQCSRYTNDNGWDDLHRRQRVELAMVEKALDKVQEYLVSCLSILYIHRESRVISHRPIFQDIEVTRKQLGFWASETKRAAALLPRVMKYKAERLFDVSVLPNRKKWYEGDPGTAIVRVKSDIPVAIGIDIVMLECRSVDIRDGRKPSLRSREDEYDKQASEDPSLSAAERGLFHAESSSWNPELSDVVVLKSSGDILLHPGVNDISVSVDEVPRAGCYKVTLISLFLGNLKLVQAASKTQSQPIVTMKNGDIPSQTAITIPISEVIEGEVKYPPLFAAPRLPSASLEFVHVPKLFLLGNALQHLGVKVKVGVNGVRQSSKFSCTLNEFTRRRSHSKSLFVQFADKAVVASSSLQRDIVVESHRKIEDANEVLEIDIQNALEPNEELQLRFDLKQLVDEDCDEGQLECERGRGRRCVLLATYICSESRDQRHREFSCQGELPLVFAPMLDISARLETRCECYEEDGSKAIGYNENTLEDGGTLLCSVQSLLGWDEEACITKVSLDTPQWLEQRQEDPSLQSQLIPSVLRGSSVFVCSFDLLVRDFVVVQDDGIETTPRSVEDLSLRKGFLRRRLSRKIIKSPDISESQDDFGDWGADGEHSSVKEDQVKPGGLEFADKRSKDDEQTVPSLAGNELDKVEQNSHGTLSTEETLELKEARDVVDLSTPGEESQDAPSGMLTPPILPQGLPMSATTATLRLDLNVSGVDGDAYIEQKISLAALRVFRKRYRVERRVSSEAESGKLMTLKFAVSSIFGCFSGEDEKHEVVALHYEIDADPSVWLVVGRRRGQMMISDVITGKGSTTMIPLRCGRHRVPSLRLYTNDGRGLPLSTYENVDEYMQIVIRPCRAVVSCCASDMKAVVGGEQKGDGSGSRGKMPEVVASDSFFES
ncbi:Trafficking protein particle complex subunit 10 TRAPPC10 [Gracilaria domingensis]|nr:Trafficking protein particle complex subunit 10 TRAPPC10 [Gracilaria domingensis]